MHLNRRIAWLHLCSRNETGGRMKNIGSKDTGDGIISELR